MLLMDNASGHKFPSYRINCISCCQKNSDKLCFVLESGKVEIRFSGTWVDFSRFYSLRLEGPGDNSMSEVQASEMTEYDKFFKVNICMCGVENDRVFLHFHRKVDGAKVQSVTLVFGTEFTRPWQHHLCSSSTTSRKLYFSYIECCAAIDGRYPGIDRERTFDVEVASSFQASRESQNQPLPHVVLSLVTEDFKAVPVEQALHRSGGKQIEPQELAGATVMFKSCLTKATSFKNEDGSKIRVHDEPRRFRLKAELIAGSQVLETAYSDPFIVAWKLKRGRPSRERARGSGCPAGVSGLQGHTGEQLPGRSLDNYRSGCCSDVDDVSPQLRNFADAQQLSQAECDEWNQIIADQIHMVADQMQIIAGQSNFIADQNQIIADQNQIIADMKRKRADLEEELHAMKQQVLDEDICKYFNNDPTLDADS